MSTQEKKGRTQTLKSGERYVRFRDSDGRIVDVFTLEPTPHADEAKAKAGELGSVKVFVKDGYKVMPAPAGNYVGKLASDVPELQAIIDENSRSKTDATATNKPASS